MSDLKPIIDGLRNGETILYPTDTIWGVGCDATNEEACKKIMEIKKRSENKSFILLVDGFPMLQRYIPEFHEVCYDLVDLATRPLTIIYPGAKGLAPSVLAKDGSIGIRITTDPTCLKLIRGMRKPLVSTSANISNEKSASRYDEISEEIKTGVDHILKEKMKETCSQPSQIIKIGVSGDVKVLRK